MACIPDAQQTDQAEASAIPDQDRGYRKAVFPLPDGRQLVLTIYGDLVYGEDAKAGPRPMSASSLRMASTATPWRW